MSNLTLFDLTYAVARRLGIITEGVATGGSTTTIVDNPYRAEADNYWQYGSAWIVKDAGGAGAAPEAEFTRISASVASTFTITTGTWTAAVAAGDRYALSRKFAGTTPWLDEIIQAVNNAISGMGDVPVSDITTITTAADQTEYSVNVAANQDIRQVFIQTDNADANDNQWIKLSNWDILYKGTGTADLLILGLQPSSGYIVRVDYMAGHSRLAVASDQLNEHVPRNLVIYPAVRDCFLKLKNHTGWDNWDLQISEWSKRADEAQRENFITAPRKSSRYMVAGVADNTANEFNGTTVRL
jgi:hypothetical protein